MADKVFVANRAMVKVGALYFDACFKCGGSGAHWAYWNANGKCFKCLGTGRTGKGWNFEDAEKRAVKLANTKAKAQAKKAAEVAAKADAAFAKWQAAEAEEAAERAAKDAAKAEVNAPFEFLGAVGDKVTVTATVQFLKTVETQFGTTKLAVLAVDETHEVKMFTSAAWVYEVDKGDTVTLNATVKKHEVYEGKKTTMLARPKLVQPAEATELEFA